MQPLQSWTSKVKEIIFVLLAIAASVSVYQLGQKDVFRQFMIDAAPAKVALPAPQPAPVPEQKPTEPVTLTIHAPQPALVIDGVSTLFLAETTGPAGTPKWRVIPASAGTIRKTSADGRRAELLAIGEGTCTVLVDVAGDGRQLATDSVEIEVISFGAEADEKKPEHEMPSPAPMQQQVTVAQLVTGALANIEPDHRKDSGKVSGVIKSVISRIEAGHFAPETNAVAVIESQLNQAMGADAAKWQTFIVALDAIVEQLRQSGQITTVASSVPTLAEVSAALDAAH